MTHPDAEARAVEAAREWLASNVQRAMTRQHLDAVEALYGDREAAGFAMGYLAAERAAHDRAIEDAKVTEDALIERTLKHLAACSFAELERESLGDDERRGPADSSWPDLLAAVMEGFQRGWLAEAKLYREDEETRLVWRATDSGDRAMSAYRRRSER